MKIAHFGIFGPNLSGQFETTRDLILAERSIGIDAQFIDYGTENRVGLETDGIETVPVSWAEKADILVRHSRVPKYLKEKPVLTALHGRPENSFLLDWKTNNKVITEINATKGPFVTFWPELVYPWTVIAREKVKYATAPVNLERYNPEGFKHEYKGGPNIIICDMWREDTTPFNVLMAACLFKDKYCKTANIHVYGAPSLKILKVLKPYLGEVYGLVKNLQTVYRAADIMITPQVIATRTVREALASGCPVVAGTGNKYATYTANPRDTEEFAKTISNCWNQQKIAGEHMKNIARLTAEKYFNPVQTANDMKTIFDEICNSL